MSRFQKTVIAIILTVFLGLGAMTASGLQISDMRYGVGKWTDAYNTHKNAIVAAFNTLTGQVAALSSLVTNWVVTENYPVVFTGALHVDGDTCTVPGDQTAKITAGKLLWADCGATDGVRASTVASASYGGGLTTINLNDSILTANLRAVSVVMSRAGIYPTSIGWIFGGDYGSPSRATLLAAKALIASNQRILSLGPGAWTVDAGLTIPINITLKPEKGAVLTVTIPDVNIAGLSRAAACVVSWSGHGLADGDIIYLSGITQAAWTVLNGHQGITVIDENSFSIPINTSGFPADYDPGTDPGLYSQTLYIHSFEAGLWQCFDAAVGKVVFGPAAVKEVLPENWGADPTGVSESAAAVQAAGVCAVYATKPLSFYGSKYLINTKVTLGNFYGVAHKIVFLQGFGGNWGNAGDGQGSVIYTENTAIDGIISIEGFNPEVDEAGNRRVGQQVRGLTFIGPGAGSGSSKGLKIYGCQDTQIESCDFEGLVYGFYGRNSDLARINKRCRFRYNDYGLKTDDSGSGYAPAGAADHWVIENNIFEHNNICDLDFYGGDLPTIQRNKFVYGAIAVRIAHHLSAYPVVTKLILDKNNVERYTSPPFQLVPTDSLGVVRAGHVAHNEFIPSSSTPASWITGTNVDADTVLEFNRDTSGSVPLYDFSASPTQPTIISTNFPTGPGVVISPGLENTPVGSTAPSTGQFTFLKSHTSTKVVSAGGTADILSIGSYGTAYSGLIVVRAYSSGVLTIRNYSVSIVGGTTATGIVQLSTEDFSGGGSPFTLTVTDTSGTTTVVLINTGAVTANFTCTFITFYSSGTLSYL